MPHPTRRARTGYWRCVRRCDVSDKRHDTANGSILYRPDGLALQHEYKFRLEATNSPHAGTSCPRPQPSRADQWQHLG
jgi:hypothetical protein